MVRGNFHHFGNGTIVTQNIVWLGFLRFEIVYFLTMKVLLLAIAVIG